MRYSLLALSLLLGACSTQQPNATNTAAMDLSNSWQQKLAVAKTSAAYFANSDSAVALAPAPRQIAVLDPDSGLLQWQQRLRNNFSNSFSLNSSHLALVDDKAILKVLAAKTGAPLWQQQLSSIAVAQPTITADKILVHTIDGKIYCYDHSGKILWQHSEQVPFLKLNRGSGIAVTAQQAIVGFANARVIAFDLTDGSILWQQNIAYPTGAAAVNRLVDIDITPKIIGSQVIVASIKGKLAALDLATGQINWQRSLKLTQPLAATQKELIAVNTANEILAITLDSGVVLWKQNALSQSRLTAPILTQSRVIVADDGGDLYLLSLQDGSITSRQKIARAGISHSVIVAQRLLFATDNGKLLAYNIK